MKTIVILLSIIFCGKSFCQTKDTLDYNTPSSIKDVYLTTEGTIYLLEPKQKIYLTTNIVYELQKLISKQFLEEYDIGVIRTTPNTFLILQCTKLLQEKKVTSKKKRSWGGGGLKGGNKFEQWTITIDMNKNKVINIRKIKYRVHAKF